MPREWRNWSDASSLNVSVMERAGHHRGRRFAPIRVVSAALSDRSRYNGNLSTSNRPAALQYFTMIFFFKMTSSNHVCPDSVLNGLNLCR